MVGFFILIRLPSQSILFPYTTLFRSSAALPRPDPRIGELAEANEILPSEPLPQQLARPLVENELQRDRKSTRLNSSHVENSYAVFFLTKKNLYSLKDYSPELFLIGSP